MVEKKGTSIKALFAGFGGQGILFAGKAMTYAGMLQGKEVSWLPSYGPEMRGGTANCSVCIDESPIGSPLVTAPNVFVAMNRPSYLKYIDSVCSGGVVLLDSFLIQEKVERTDIVAYYVPATDLASKNNLSGLANMILFGKLLHAVKFADYNTVIAGLKKMVPSKKANLFDANVKAIQIGMNYAD